MHTLRVIKWFIAIGWFVLLLTACSAHNVPAVATNQTVHIPLGTTLLTSQSDSSVFSVSWSPDDTRLASAGSDHTVRVWNATTGECIFTYNGHSNAV
jgi:WD40 repeat protein